MFFPRLTFSILVLLLSLGCSQKISEPSKDLKINILHINDHHSHLEEEEKSLTINGQTIYTHIGGFPRVVSKIKELQAKKENSITLHAGDALQGSMYYTIFKSKADADMMNLIDWDAFEIGNHEFDDGDEELAKFLARLNSKNIIAANVKAAPDSLLYGAWQAYRIIERSGEKIAILGINVAEKTRTSSRPSDRISFFNELETVKKVVKELEAKGINKIILLSHFGYENDRALAAKVEGIDVIIDGDSHTLMGDFSMIGLKSVEHEYPKIVYSKNKQPVCIAQAWNYSYLVGSLTVEFNNKGEISSCQGTPILLMSNTFKQKNDRGEKVAVNAAQQKEILQLIEQYPQLQIVSKNTTAVQQLSVYKEQIESRKKEIIGELTEYIGHNRIPNDKYDGKKTLALGSEIAPLVAKSFYLKSKRSDFCIQNAGGVRSGLKAGQLTIENVYRLLPFSNTLIELRLTGAEIKESLENALSYIYDKQGSTGAFPYGYAIRYDIDSSQAKGLRVTNIEVKNRQTNQWQALDKSRSYIVVANSYIASGKDGYNTFNNITDRTDTYLDYAMSFADMVKRDRRISKLPADEHPIKSFR